MKLVIVESPTKAKTISRFLNRDFKVESSYGHVRDLPKSKLGVDIKNDFEPQYVIPDEAQKRITNLKKTAKKAKEIILATDEDREGEAIAWHLTQALELNVNAKQTPNVERIVFHEITKKAITEALQKPRGIDMNLVDAQQARRVLDRLVGYELSPFLWQKIKRGLSAGRVQSAAVRLIAEREEEIKKFKSEEYWTIAALLLKRETRKAKREINENKFEALLTKKDDKTIPKLGIKSKAEADNILKDLQKAEYKVSNVQKNEVKRTPPPPFTTSTLQQEANNRFRFSAKQTMRIAQQLYEGINFAGEQTGLITYMRTDSVSLSFESMICAKTTIEKKFGKAYALETPRIYKTKSKQAQEAHEAIRPAMPEKSPDDLKKYLDPQQYKLYKLIWQRMIASQMREAIFDATAADISAIPLNSQRINYTFRANGSVIKFDGFLKIYEGKISAKENILPELSKEEKLELEKLLPSQKFTQPPARYSEAALIKALEENGIGRPSTYAPTISTIQDRGYAEKDENRKLFPTEIGIVVNNLLVEHFPKIVDIKFTAAMEEDLDEIAEGKIKWRPVVKNFYGPFKENLIKKTKEVQKEDLLQKLGRECPECGAEMVIKFGKFGKFYACGRYPDCKHTEATEEEQKTQKENEGEICEKCGAPMAVKRGKYGMFLGCSNYPECKNVKKIQRSIGVKCPKCADGDIIERKTKRGKLFYGCSKWPKCDFTSWKKPLPNN
ncbi:MAG: DNA topoisomerase I [Candidatus Tagabacteria bacterium RIFCSPLOWO2_01_FULL_39_11]|uniref:DNA topoisomerase 1 n=1 Tax=Candidatus Tagabacteria bacterium RIFCSPLOWO2_01_FULL_39_11 TaxID=1802295 RepID=A0A1G2LNX8_9BACT|nr:MAG: DNA topoisomerase I [Candidatus Tagabacteria bacterium RIFCSPLOWO2_01_FULL_39_11]